MVGPWAPAMQDPDGRPRGLQPAAVASMRSLVEPGGLSLRRLPPKALGTPPLAGLGVSLCPHGRILWTVWAVLELTGSL